MLWDIQRPSSPTWKTQIKLMTLRIIARITSVSNRDNMMMAKTRAKIVAMVVAKIVLMAAKISAHLVANIAVAKIVASFVVIAL